MAATQEANRAALNSWLLVNLDSLRKDSDRGWRPLPIHDAAKKKQKQKQLKTRIEHAVQFIPCKGYISKSVYFHMLLSGNSI